MAKPTKFATPICIGLTIFTLVGVLIGILTKNPVWPMIFLLPTIGYELYRTEGRSTRAAATGLLAIYIIELVLIIGEVEFNLAEYLGITQTYISGYKVPLGDARVVAPAIMAVLSVVLFVRTWGVYTRWLAVVIFISSFAVVYSLDPQIFKELLQLTSREASDRI